MWTLRREGQVIAPDERLPLPAMFGIGAQHVLAMFGATALVPVLTGFPVSTTLLFAGIGTLLFVLITGNRVPSFTGSSFAFIAPVTAAINDGSMAEALGGIVAAGIVLALIGVLIDRAGYRVVEFLLPPVVTGAIVALIGLNLAPVAKDQFSQQAGLALFTLAAILIGTVALRGLLQKLQRLHRRRRSATCSPRILGKVNWDGVRDADWIGFPDFTTPSFTWHAIILVVPAVILVLIAENAAHIKAVAAMTERDLDPLIGRSIAADGAATTLAGMFGGSGTTTYAENIGVMGLTRVYSTLAYIIAGGFAIALALLPKFGAIISAIPIGVLGGAVTVLFGLIAVLGARIWIEAKVDFRDPVNLAVGRRRADRRRRRLHAQLGRLHVRRHHARHHRRGRHLPGAQAAERRSAFPSHGPSAKPGDPMSGLLGPVPARRSRPPPGRR